MEHITLKDDNNEFELPVVVGTENEKGIYQNYVQKLAILPLTRAMVIPVHAKAILHSSMVRRVFFVIGVYP